MFLQEFIVYLSGNLAKYHSRFGVETKIKPETYHNSVKGAS